MESIFGCLYDFQILYILYIRPCKDGEDVYARAEGQNASANGISNWKFSAKEKRNNTRGF